MLLATLSTLKKEKEEYTQRVAFLDKFIEKINNNEYSNELDELEWLNTAYKLEKERDFKKSLIEQREIQIKQAEEQLELKKQAVEETPGLIEDAKESYNTMLDDLDKLKKGKRTKEVNEFIKKLEAQVDQTDTILDNIEVRFNENPEHKHLLNDFRQLHEIVKLTK